MPREEAQIEILRMQKKEHEANCTVSDTVVNVRMERLSGQKGERDLEDTGARRRQIKP